jgi:hypothetical protein
MLVNFSLYSSDALGNAETSFLFFRWWIRTFWPVHITELFRDYESLDASTLLVLVLVLARLVLVGRLVWLLLVLENLRPHYFSCSPGCGAWGSVYLFVVCTGCSTSSSNVDGPLQAINMTPWKGTQPVARSLPTENNTDIERKYTSMHQVGFEPTNQASQWTKTFCASDRMTIMIGTMK